MSNMLKVRGAGMDPVSVVDCSWAVAGIPKRGAKGVPPAKSCSRYMSDQWSSG